MISVRSEREIDLLREANQIVAKVHDALQAMVAPGITTAELDAVAEDIILSSDAKPAFKGYHGFPASTCISVDEEIVHGIPGNRKLQSGEIVSIVVGVAYRGYYGDAAVSWPCGEIDAERQALLGATDMALSEAIKAAAAGNVLQDIGRAVESVCLPKGYGIVRDFVGHGIGTAMHEEPQIPNYDDGRKGPRLKAGMVFAIEPMINLGTEKFRVLEDDWTAVTLDGKPSAHFEHSVVVREGGGEILSGSKVHSWGQRKAS